jgi:hypothetical protein
MHHLPIAALGVVFTVAHCERLVVKGKVEGMDTGVSVRT